MTLLDIVLVPLAYLYVFGVILLASKLKGLQRVDGPMARKIVHLGIGILVIAAPLLFSNRWYPTFIGISFIFITYLTSPISPRESWRLSAFKDGHGLGTVYYSLSLTALLYFFFDTGWIIQVGFLPLVFGDAFANIVGRRYGSLKWPGTDKSVQGSIAGGLASLVIVFLSLVFYLLIDHFPGDFTDIMFLSIGAGLLMPMVELISPFGLDNLSIPLSNSILALVIHSHYAACQLLICLF